ncbi:MAG: hypothetical protein D4R82_05720 [Dehalococcoidia bacterium]|nr:MAG: hypothetical protein D4R82_05720 [Dehalococcoidia bacterium]
MKEIDNQSRFPVTTPPQLLNQGFIWVNNRLSFIKTKKFSEISSWLTLPAFMLGFLFLALIIGLLLFAFSLYVIFHLLISLPSLRKGRFSDSR